MEGGARAPQRLGQQEPPGSGDRQPGGVELDEGRVADGGAGAPGHGEPVGGRAVLVGRRGVQPAAAARGQQHRAARRSPPTPSSGSRTHSPVTAPSSSRASSTAVPASRVTRGVAACAQDTHQLGARRVGGVDGPSDGLSALACEVQVAGVGRVGVRRVAVELRPVGQQVVEAVGCLSRQQAGGERVAQPVACPQGVGHVQVHRVVVPQWDGQAPLGPRGGPRPAGRALVHHDARRGRRGAGWPRTGPPRRRRRSRRRSGTGRGRTGWGGRATSTWDLRRARAMLGRDGTSNLGGGSCVRRGEGATPVRPSPNGTPMRRHSSSPSCSPRPSDSPPVARPSTPPPVTARPRPPAGRPTPRPQRPVRRPPRSRPRPSPPPPSRARRPRPPRVTAPRPA